MFKTADHAKAFITAGNATITIESAKTGKHFTYRVTQAKDYSGNKTDRWFVSLMTGPNNTSDFTYLGMLQNGALKLTAKSKGNDQTPSVRGFRYVWSNIAAGTIPSDAHIHHEGHCGRCGRTLTVPESIESGFGPECIQMVGGY